MAAVTVFCHCQVFLGSFEPRNTRTRIVIVLLLFCFMLHACQSMLLPSWVIVVLCMLFISDSAVVINTKYGLCPCYIVILVFVSLYQHNVLSELFSSFK